jgi:hypothetical protein
LEEENDQLNDELHKFRIVNFKLQDSLGSHQKQLKEVIQEVKDYEQLYILCSVKDYEQLYILCSVK